MNTFIFHQRVALKSIFFIGILIFFSDSTIPAAQQQTWQIKVEQLIQNGRYTGAIQTIDSNIKLLDPTSVKYIEAQIMKANVLKLTGRYNKALSLLSALDSYFQNKPSPRLCVRYYNTMGSILLNFSQPEKASKVFEKSLQFAKQSKNLLLACEVLNEIGLLHCAYSDYPGFFIKSIEAFNEAIRLSEDIQLISKDHQFFHGQLLINRAKTFVIQKNHTRTADKVKQIENAFQYVAHLPDNYQKAIQLFEIADMLEQLSVDDPKNVQKYIKKTYSINTQILSINQIIKNDRVASKGFLNQGALYEKTNQIDDAISLTLKSIFYGQKNNESHILYKAFWQLGRLYKKKDDLESAIHQYEKAITILNPIRKQIYSSDFQKNTAFDQQIKPVYIELAEIYFEKSSLCQDSEKYKLNIRNAWMTMDEVKKAELENIFNDECVSSKKEEYLKLGEPLGPVAVMYLIPFQKKPGFIMYLPNGFKHFRLKVDTPTFNKTIYDLRKAIEKFEDFESYALRLYEWMISPIYNELKLQKIETLVVAADGALRMLPFSVLLKPDETYLIEEFSIVTIPALHLTRTKSMNRESPNIMLCGISQKKVLGNIIFPALPRVIKELEEIKKIVPGEIFLDESFSQSNLFQILPQKTFNIIHLATHGEFGAIPEKTFLLTHDERFTMNHLEKLIQQTQTSSIDLLTLSACQTAIGDERAAFGLAGVAVKSGANCALATLWSVDDYASQTIITNFYKNVYTENMSKAKALQQAQIRLLEKVQFWQPSFWAAFLLIGNWY